MTQPAPTKTFERMNISKLTDRRKIFHIKTQINRKKKFPGQNDIIFGIRLTNEKSLSWYTLIQWTILTYHTVFKIKERAGTP